MHSDELKELIEDILQNTESDAIKVQCLNALAVNELNWGIYYTKEEMKKVNDNLVSLNRLMKEIGNKLDRISC